MTELTDAERARLADWWDSDWPDTADGVLGTLAEVVAGIVAARVAECLDAVEEDRTR